MSADAESHVLPLCALTTAHLLGGVGEDYLPSTEARGRSPRAGDRQQRERGQSGWWAGSLGVCAGFKRLHSVPPPGPQNHRARD